MLVLSRKPKETIVIENGRIVLHVLSVSGNTVRLGLEADRSIDINRGEVQAAIDHKAQQSERRHES